MIITQTPLRISFAGGGTDFKDFYLKEEGMVLSTAIDKYVYITIHERYDEKIYLNYSDEERVASVEEIKHPLIRSAMREAGVSSGVEIMCYADIPSEGSGLGSSSSFTTGLLNALYHYQGRQMPAEWLAKKACEIEIDICKEPIGKQDQYAAAFGGFNLIHFRKSDSVEVEPLAIPRIDLRELNRHLMLFYTNITRKSASILTDQKNNIPAKLEYLKKMKPLALEMRKAILEKRFDDFGRALDKGWQLKKSLANSVSNLEIDAMYKSALSAGALGGKICGAGGGGFVLLFAPLAKQTSVRQALAAYREMPFHFETDGSKVIFNQRGYSWRDS
jgi:D-glycero-alpha-D-manno-heptose-7-phosphate kinase